MKNSTVQRLVLAACATSWLAAPPVFSAQTPSLDEVLARMAAYVNDFIPRFANVVAVEHYEQRTTAPVRIAIAPGRIGGGGGGNLPTLWRLRSDFLLVRYPVGELDWMVFRDVAEVDGERVRHAEDRLLTLFAEPTIESAERAALINRESARYHIPGGSSAVTNPLLVLALMQPRYQPRLRFTLGGEERALGPGVRAVRFEEIETRESPGARDRERLPPLLGAAGRVRGTAFVEVASGRIVKTDARLSGGSVRGTSTSATTFAQDDTLGLAVPKEMRTTWTYETRPVNGIARYGEFRRFTVQTDSQVQPSPQP